MSDSKNFHVIVNDYWEYLKQDSPILATRSGDHRYNDQLGDNSENSMVLRIKKAKWFLERLTSIDPITIDLEDQLNFRILKEKLELDIERLQWKVHRMPISSFGSFYSFLPMLGSIVSLRTKQDYENLLKRYRQIPCFVDNIIERMQMGLQEGQIPPKITLKGVEQAINTQVGTDLDENPYLQVFNRFPENISKQDQQDLKVRAIELVTDHIFPALTKFLSFVKEEYEPKCLEEVGAKHLPDGQKFYKHCIKYFTSLDLTADEIHDIGLKEVKRIREEMEEVMRQVDFKGTLNDFFEFMRTDDQFYAKNKEELLLKTAFVLKKIDGKLPEIFKTLPRLPYGIQEIPEYEAPNTTTAYYRPGSGDGTKSGTYFVNTYDLKSRPLYEIEALSLHEAVPGHHLQLALQQEIEIPEFRKYSNYTSFVEGWGLYSERLGLETGFYEDPYSNFGRLSYEMWRACRLVVDTGMHALGWTRQQAIDFMAENSSLTLLNITNEVDRYIGWPGQALAYKLGELKIRELRSFAENELGIHFDLREFHDIVLLSGSLPLSVLEDKVKKWVSSYQT